MLYEYLKPNHNQESKYSPLNDPGQNVFPFQSIYYRPCPKKVFPSYTFGTNAELPQYLQLPNLYQNKYSIDHGSKQKNKKLFLSNINSSNIFTNDNQTEKHHRGRRYISTIPNRDHISGDDEDSKVHQVMQSQGDDDYKHYGLRKYDIISNRNYIPFKRNKVIPQRNYFSNLFKINQEIGRETNDMRIIANRYRKLNGGQYVKQLKLVIPPRFVI